MSQEITTKIQLIASKSGGASIDSKLNSTTVDMAGNEMIGGDTMLVATGSWQLVSMGAITGAPSRFHVMNKSANYVQFSLDNAGTKIFGRLQAGQEDIWSLESGTLYAQAHTAAVRIQYWATEA